MELVLDPESSILIWQGLFVTACAFQLFYLVFIQFRLVFYKSKSGVVAQSDDGVSVVMAARNEYDNLLVNLPAVLEQDYPNFEVIVVNDGSWDDSMVLLREYQVLYPKLHVINVAENEQYDGNKKYAVTLGLKAARFERVLLTDADCKPSSRHWIRHMVGSVKADGDIVLGHSPLGRSAGFLNAFIRFDNLSTAINYLGFALAGIPYMGVGRNLSYTKGLFFGVGGFKKHYSLASGDDDLYVNEVARRGNTVVCLHQDAQMHSAAKQSWKDYWWQKRRHLTTGWRYRWLHRLLLGMQPLSMVLFFVTSISLLCRDVWVHAVVAALVVRLLLQLTIFKRSSHWLGQKDLVWLAPILEPVLVLFTTGVHFANASSKPTRWKKI